MRISWKALRRVITAGLAVAGLAILTGLYFWLRYPRYELVDLGTLGGSSGCAMAVNNAGQVVGRLDFSKGVTRAFIWDAKRGMRDLGTLGGVHSHALDINERGQVAGVSYAGDGHIHAFLWDPNKGMTDLGTHGAREIEAHAINDHGEIAGQFTTIDGQLHAFYWDSNSGFREIDTVYGERSNARSINEKGEVVGRLYTASSRGQAFHWDKAGGMAELIGPDGATSYATCINNRGVVVGHFLNRQNDNFNAFVWTKKDGFKQLRLAGGQGYAHKVNDSGEIIGRLTRVRFLFISAKDYHFLRTSSGRIINLNRFSPSESEVIAAVNINNRGWIVGQIRNTITGVGRPILLRPVK